MCSNQIDNNIHQGQLVLYRSSNESTLNPSKNAVANEFEAGQKMIKSMKCLKI